MSGSLRELQKTTRIQNKIEFDIRKRPLFVSLDGIEFIPRYKGEQGHTIFAIYKCKKDCKTIFTKNHMKEIVRFSDIINSDYLWPRLCVRDSKKFADGMGCTTNSYFNLSSNFENFIRDDLPF